MNSVIAYIAYFIAATGLGHDIHRGEIYCTAQTVYHEARGEPLLGQIAVASVIKNRVESKRYKDTACGVVHTPVQFTGLERSGFVPTDVGAWGLAVEISLMVAVGYVNDPTNGALNYYAERGINRLEKDPWPELTVMADIGNHRFKR